MESKKILSISYPVIVMVLLLYTTFRLTLYFDFEGSFFEFVDSFIKVQSDENVVIAFNCWVGLLILFYKSYYKIIYNRFTKDREEIKLVDLKRIRSLTRVSLLTVILYILALITTSMSNIGPMLFGGALALFIVDYQSIMEMINKSKKT